MPHIPGLVPAAYVAGSRHSAPTPRLLRADVGGDGSVDFAWRAVGSSVYAVAATGAPAVSRWKRGDGCLVPAAFSGLGVRCACPDGERQLAATESTGTLTVCKHAGAALDSVLDPGGAARWEEEGRRILSAGAAAGAGAADRSVGAYRDALRAALLGAGGADGEEGGDAGSGAYCAAGAVILPSPPGPTTLRVDGVGDVPLPISEGAFDKLTEAAEVAPFGRGLDTVVDEGYRKARQVDAARVQLSEELKGAVRASTEEASDKLGTSDWGVEARLYKLVLYDTGGFFRPHKDTEKEKGMFATLAVQLPVEGGHTGGCLVINHAGHSLTMDWSLPLPDTEDAREKREGHRAKIIKEASDISTLLHTNISALSGGPNAQGASADAESMTALSNLRPKAIALAASLEKAAQLAADEASIKLQSQRFPCAAFYADCTHELTRITSGRRIVLLYNLVRTSPGVAHTNPAGARSVAVRDAVSRWEKDVSGPSKLVVPLAHKYTETNFDFDELKGVDRSRSDLLRSCDGLAVNLVLFEKHVSGSAESSHRGYSRKSYRWGCHDDSDDGEGAEMDEILEESIEVSRWISLHGGSDELQNCLKPEDSSGGFDNRDLLYGKLFHEDDDPDKKEYEGFTGNAGPSLEFWYYSAALIIWPAHKTVKVAYSVSLEAALNEVRRTVANGDASNSHSALNQLFDCLETLPLPSRHHAERRCVFGPSRWLGSRRNIPPGKIHLVVPLIEQFPEFAERFLDLVTSPNTSEPPSFLKGISHKDLARGICVLIEKVSWDRLGPKVIALVNTATEYNFEHHISLLVGVGPSAAHFTAVLDAVSCAAMRLIDRGAWGPTKDLVLRLAEKDEISQAEQSRRAVTTLLQKLCGRKSAIPACAVVLKTLKERDYNIHDSISSAFCKIILKFLSNTQHDNFLDDDDVPDYQDGLEYLISIGKLDDVAERADCLCTPLLVSSIHFAKAELSKKECVTHDEHVALANMFYELSCHEELFDQHNKEIFTEETIIALLKDAAWGLMTAGPAVWSKALNNFGRGMGLLADDGLTQKILTAFTGHKEDLEVFYSQSLMQSVILSYINKLRARCSSVPNVDYSVPCCSAAEEVLHKPTGPSNCILFGQFAGISKARAKAKEIDVALGWRGNAHAKGIGRNAHIQIDLSKVFKDLVKRDTERTKFLNLLGKYTCLLLDVAPEHPEGHVRAKQNASPVARGESNPKRPRL